MNDEPKFVFNAGPVVGGALAGAGAGAEDGAEAGAAAGPEGAVVGAAAGAVIGTITGAIVGSYQNSKDDNQGSTTPGTVPSPPPAPQPVPQPDSPPLITPAPAPQTTPIPNQAPDPNAPGAPPPLISPTEPPGVPETAPLPASAPAKEPEPVLLPPLFQRVHPLMPRAAADDPSEGATESDTGDSPGAGGEGEGEGAGDNGDGVPVGDPERPVTRRNSVGRLIWADGPNAGDYVKDPEASTDFAFLMELYDPHSIILTDEEKAELWKYIGERAEAQFEHYFFKAARDWWADKLGVPIKGLSTADDKHIKTINKFRQDNPELKPEYDLLQLLAERTGTAWGDFTRASEDMGKVGGGARLREIHVPSIYQGNGSDDIDEIGFDGHTFIIPEEKGGLPGKPTLGGRQVPDGEGRTVKVPQTSEPYLESLLPDILKQPAVLAKIRAINPAVADEIEAGQPVPVVSEVVKADTNGKVTVYQTRPAPAQAPGTDPDVEAHPGDTPAGDIVSALHGLITSFYLMPPPPPPIAPIAARVSARPSWIEDLAHSTLNTIADLSNLAAAVTAPTGPLPRLLFTPVRRSTNQSLSVNITRRAHGRSPITSEDGHRAYTAIAHL